MAKYIVATVDEIPPGQRKILEVAGRSLGVFNIAGKFYALRNSCPHQGGPLCQGRLTGFLEASVPGEYEYRRKGEILRCPWHGWEFDVKSGQSWWNPTQKRVRKYKVRLESGLEIQDEVKAVKAAATGLQKGAYTAETYGVSIEKQYVVVEIVA